ncbi:MAG: acyltransferase family protein [Paludibacteraceae bacterium]|nr:acyltransferase family protein [Paludibacteraceae bacterium]
MIVMHHFATSVWFPGMAHVHTPGSTGEAIVLLSHCLFFIGVNCFVLISGYFSIKTSLRGFLHLYGFYAFYALLIALTQYLGDAQYAAMPLSAKCFHIAVHSLMPWDNNNFWFLNAYLGLFMVTPLLNVAIANMSKLAYIRILVLLTILNVIFGNFLSVDLLNTWGFCVAQFVYLYMIGGFIRKYVSIESMKSRRWQHFSVYMLSALTWGAFVAVQVFQFPYLGRFFKAFSYNNLFVLTAAIGLFLFMLSFDIKSRTVNWFASSCLAAYLLQGSVLPYDWYIGVLEKYPPTKSVPFAHCKRIIFNNFAII